jgi:hypothetical protein
LIKADKAGMVVPAKTQSTFYQLNINLFFKLASYKSFASQNVPEGQKEKAVRGQTQHGLVISYEIKRCRTLS